MCDNSNKDYKNWKNEMLKFKLLPRLMLEYDIPEKMAMYLKNKVRTKILIEKNEKSPCFPKRAKRVYELLKEVTVKEISNFKTDLFIGSSSKFIKKK